MFKIALFAASLLAAAAMGAVMAETVVSQPGVAATAACLPGQPPELACALPPPEGPGAGATSADEFANLAVAGAPVADWTLLRAVPGAGVDFADAAADPGSVLPAPLDRDHPQPLLPALFALGALVVLLRKRPY